MIKEIKISPKPSLFEISYHGYGYFSPYPWMQIHITTLLIPFLIGFTWMFFGFLWSCLWILLIFFSWGKITVIFSKDTGKDECEYPSWFISLYAVDSLKWWYFDCFYWHWGNKYHFIYLPHTFIFLQAEYLSNDGVFKLFKNISDNDKKSKTINVLDFDNSEAIATYSIERRTWQRRFAKFLFLPFFKHTEKSLDIEFSEEMGHKKGSWKGGITGISVCLKKGEDEISALNRIFKKYNIKIKTT